LVDFQKLTLIIQQDIRTQSDHFCSHLSSYRFTLVLVGNPWSTLSKCESGLQCVIQ